MVYFIVDVVHCSREDSSDSIAAVDGASVVTPNT
jgi:hypothetical protein